jgi:ribose transport system substrate-binding protein
LGQKYPDIKLVDTQSSEGDPQKAVMYTENMIQAYPNFSAIIGIDATAGPAMVSVWKAKGWQNSNEHMIITFDDMPDNLQGMRDNYINAIVAQRQSNWGVDVLDLLHSVTSGGTYPDYIDTGSIEITLDNIDTYVNEPSYVEQ